MYVLPNNVHFVMRNRYRNLVVSTHTCSCSLVGECHVYWKKNSNHNIIHNILFIFKKYIYMLYYVIFLIKNFKCLEKYTPNSCSRVNLHKTFRKHCVHEYYSCLLFELFIITYINGSTDPNVSVYSYVVLL